MKAMRLFRRTGSTLARAASFPRPSVGAGLGAKVIPARESDGPPRISVGVLSFSGTKSRDDPNPAGLFAGTNRWVRPYNNGQV